MILIPCMDMVHTAFMHSLLLLDKPQDVMYGIHKGSLIYDSRNQLLEAAKENKADRILWLDSDMDIPMDAMRKLNEDLDAGHEIVSGLYFKRKPPFSPVIFKECRLDKIGTSLIPISTYYNDYPKDDLFEVAAFGFGCVMMTMDAVSTILRRFGMMPFMPVGGFGEDLSFCMRAREAGIQLWADSRVKCGHVGYKTYTALDYRGNDNAG